ncbi:tryptophan--tRNA ligase [Gloeobacter violaceus]|uniref:Tryptophan--tRNA ligase n=1 Tax=Gloeobacter violaceus (strain ATCC 29082 / PCC 7421) TaxID=251221 RepID=SYW_GLOVI|nr:tryptophan--tRNA ligase [Gloeobacter violaceus]Q7NCG8.1 RecName: Full=Tryptophan--tRNA ligase; AltName: Full=Tryptophanyl-tRNA synthetase; Short=TrpRS [Gloeobacter violaceus PCC 7421]BAC90952.1 tryptophanyl-tRNA synthetase [Gloeobacter violaceus PCC 7421]
MPDDSTAPKRILSGAQPTGQLHLGNYLGAVRNWVSEQRQYDSYFCVVDLHALTVPQEAAELRAATRRTAALYLACGIDPERSTVFVQSHVSAHTELTWLFNCLTPINWLERMIQFKEKAIKLGEEVGIGLFDYPVLQAADILLYEPHLVPVGEDQRQHLELTRDIARRFNDRYGESLRVPEMLIRKEGARVMSLQDGTSKMSKSDPSDLSRLNLLDAPEKLRDKIKRAKSDAVMGLKFDPARPECTNLLTIYQLLSGESPEAVEARFADAGFGRFKPILADLVIEYLRPIRERYDAIAGESGYLEGILREGALRASKVAGLTLERIRDRMGLLPPF